MRMCSELKSKFASCPSPSFPRFYSFLMHLFIYLFQFVSKCKFASWPSPSFPGYQHFSERSIIFFYYVFFFYLKNLGIIPLVSAFIEDKLKKETQICKNFVNCFFIYIKN